MINCSNLRVGGGIQVADSICRELYKYSKCRFIVVYPKVLADSARAIETYDNVKTVFYEMPMNVRTILFSQNSFLDSLVEKESIKGVLTVFGPSRWRPQVYHLCGFARSQLVIPESPFWDSLSMVWRLKYAVRKRLMRNAFGKCSDAFWTESKFISDRVEKMYPWAKVYTATNNCNQVCDDDTKWDRSIRLPDFEGLTLLTISANYPHKNLPIVIPTIHVLKRKYPNLKFRFVLTLKEEQFPRLTEIEKKHVEFVGPVKVEQCPNLYKQSDVMFLPTLLECFSASYAEAMKMRVPILTTDLSFAHGLCGEAALYYEAMNPESLADSIWLLANDERLKSRLVIEGVNQLDNYDTYQERARKHIEILCEESK